MGQVARAPRDRRLIDRQNVPVLWFSMVVRRPSGRHLLAIAAIPPRDDAIAIAASVCGLAATDVRMRLTGILPRVLLTGGAERVAALSSALEQQGFATLVCDPADAPEDPQRIVARRLELGPDGFVAVERAGDRHSVHGDSITLLQRGVRTSIARETVSRSGRKLSLGRAALTGGLLISRNVKTREEQVSESREAFLLVHRGEHRAVILYEQRLDYRFLGDELEQSAIRNLSLTTTRIRTFAQAPLDERAAQQRFVQALLPAAVADPLDLALHLVELSHLRG
jgi:hypothetical protein